VPATVDTDVAVVIVGVAATSEIAVMTPAVRMPSVSPTGPTSTIMPGYSQPRWMAS
jgi:hypothetical protein